MGPVSAAEDDLTHIENANCDPNDIYHSPFTGGAGVVLRHDLRKLKLYYVCHFQLPGRRWRRWRRSTKVVVVKHSSKCDHSLILTFLSLVAAPFAALVAQSVPVAVVVAAAAAEEDVDPLSEAAESSAAAVAAA